MLGELTPAQIERVLLTEVVGRLGCASHDRAYVVPITYAYDGKSVFAHSAEGLKVQMMRENPKICFEVDRLENMTNWESVIAWGSFEELRGAEAEEATRFLSRRLRPFSLSESATGLGGSDGRVRRHESEAPRGTLVVYRLVLTEKTGRFETTRVPSVPMVEAEQRSVLRPQAPPADVVPPAHRGIPVVSPT